MEPGERAGRGKGLVLEEFAPAFGKDGGGARGCNSNKKRSKPVDNTEGQRGGRWMLLVYMRANAGDSI